MLEANTTSCPLCGYAAYDGHGHPHAGKRTPPKTLWCTGKPRIPVKSYSCREGYHEHCNESARDCECPCHSRGAL